MKKIKISRLSEARKSPRGAMHMPKDEMSKDLQEELLRFAELHPATRLSRNLRTMLIEFLMYDGAMEVNYLPDLLYDLEGLFHLLEVLQAENLSGKA